MANNNPAHDRYNPPSNLTNDFELTRFSELNIGELLWLSDERSDDNHSFRKSNEHQAMNVHTRQMRVFDANDKVYYRT